MNPAEHAQLLRELADTLSGCYTPLEPSREVHLLATRARQAAEGIEGRGVPSDEEIIEFWNCHCAGDGDTGIIKLARFGGGEELA